jgi:hypothetical protein
MLYNYTLYNIANFFLPRVFPGFDERVQHENDEHA